MSYKKQITEFNTASILLLLTIILSGCFFRFSNLSCKVFWVDEVATIVRVYGYTITDVTNSLTSQDIVDRHALMSLLTINSERTLGDSFDALIKSPEHAPLYFLLTRFWMQWRGDSIATMRSLSAVFSLCALPSLYWLCQELFKRSPVTQMAVGIMSISPFYVAYAQEARPYSLWTVTILLSGASFLRAKRLNKRSAWLLYGLCLIIGFYTSLFSIYIVVFQGLYLLVNINNNNLIIIRNFIITTVLAGLAFFPWIWVIINHLDLLHDTP